MRLRVGLQTRVGLPAVQVHEVHEVHEVERRDRRARVAFWVERLGAEPADISAFVDADADVGAFEGSMARGAASLAKVLTSHFLALRALACDLCLRTGRSTMCCPRAHSREASVVLRLLRSFPFLPRARLRLLCFPPALQFHPLYFCEGECAPVHISDAPVAEFSQSLLISTDAGRQGEDRDRNAILLQDISDDRRW